MTFRDFRDKYGIRNLADFSRRTGIPYSTLQNWSNDVNAPAPWLIPILEELISLRQENDVLKARISSIVSAISEKP